MRILVCGFPNNYIYNCMVKELEKDEETCIISRIWTKPIYGKVYKYFDERGGEMVH